MNEKNLKLAQFLDNCNEIEVISAQIYRFYAAHFHGDERVCRLWIKTALEEENHSAQILLAKKLIGTDAFTMKIDPWIALSTRNQLLILQKNIVNSPPSLIDALHSSVQLEKRYSQFHAEQALLFEELSLYKLFKAIMDSEQNHEKALEEMLKEAQSNLLSTHAVDTGAAKARIMAGSQR